MNRPPEAFVRVSEERLLAFSCRCFEEVGMGSDQAALVSRLLVNTDLRGVRSHGTRTAYGYCQSLAQGHLNPNPEARVLRETPATAILSGDGGMGYVPMIRASELAVAKAKATGLGMSTVRHIGHYGAAGHYARICMEAGCVGFSVQGYPNEGRLLPEQKPRQLGYFGNPPICFAIPGGQGPPVVLDGGTCILGDDERGPEYDELLRVIPAAFFKSIGYTAVASLLGGGLAGITERDDGMAEAWPWARLGGMVLAIDIGSAVDEQALRDEVDRMTADVLSSYEPLPGYDRALLPGAIEEELMAAHRADGIRYGQREQDSARSLSEWLKVPLPWDDER